MKLASAVKAKFNEELPTKLQSVLTRLEKAPVQKKAENYEKLLEILTGLVEKEQIGQRILKEFASQAYTLVIGRDSTVGGQAYTYGSDKAPEAGTVLEADGKKYGVVLTDKRRDKVFYYVGLDDSGQVPRKAKLFYSDMLKDKEFSVLDEKVKGVKDSYKSYSWFDVSDDDDFVNAQMVLLSADDRYKLFMAEAPDELKEIYRANEDDNQHTNNGMMILDFAEAKQANEEIDIEYFKSSYA